MANVSPMAKRPQDAAVSEAVGQTEIDTLMRRFFEQSRSEAVEQPKPVEADGIAGRAPPAAISRWRRNCSSGPRRPFDVLVRRCQRLERDLDESQERARAQLAEQGDTIEQWKRLGAGLKAQLEASEQAAAALKAKCDAAEVRVARAEQRASALEQASFEAASQAALAEELSTKLHDSVVMAFGVGSRAHPVLEAVAIQAAAE